jgi:glycosyltransferase involved in cell wall biosynthesis
MGFADFYFRRYQAKEAFLSDRPDKRLAYCIVIPCYNEPNILNTLQSLAECKRPVLPLEIIVVVNSSVLSPHNARKQNTKSIQEIEKWKQTHEDKHFRIHIITLSNIHPKQAGVGFARKTGMDEALRRFNANNNENGVIISLDADTLCDENYLTEIEHAFQSEPALNGAVLYFEHPLDGNEYEVSIYRAIACYELYLRYFIKMLRYISFPYAFHTLGSCFCLHAGIYARQGGMNKKQGGEDFYFLHKVFPLGRFKEINTTRIIPSSRPSDRVPFGTGPVISDFVENGHDTLYVYDINAFLDIQKLFKDIPLFYKINTPGLTNLLNDYPVVLRRFLEDKDVCNILMQINRNTSNINTFKHKFFQWFGAFMIVKYVNYSHSSHYFKRPVEDAALHLLRLTNKDTMPLNNVNDLLLYYRYMQKSNEYFS